MRTDKVKSILIAAAIAVVLPLPAAAQSLDQTHELAWHPAGKTPAVIYRQRDRTNCVATAGHHQSGKSAMLAPRKCTTTAIAKSSAAPEGGEPVVAR
jgi:hypothetical protein